MKLSPSLIPGILTLSLMVLSAHAQTGNAPIMRLSTAAITAGQVAAGATVPAQTVQIYNIGTGTLAPVVSSGATWLQAALGPAAACVAPLTGSCLPINVTFNTASLAAGTYTGFLSVSDPGAIDSPQTISVTLTIIGYGAPGGITLYAAPGGGIASTTIHTHSLAAIQPSTASGGNWLTVALSESGAGTYTFYYPYVVTATTQSGQAAGTYTGSLVVSGSNTAADNQTIPVTLNVTTSPIAQLSPTSVTLLTGPGGQASQTVSIANLGQGALAVSSATPTVTNGSGWLTAVVNSGGGSVTITASAASLAPGAYQGSVALAANAANTAALTIPVSLLVTQQSGPQIGYGGVVDNAGRAPIAPGDIAVVYGAQLSPGTSSATTLPLPTSLGGVEVLINGVASPLFFTSAGQIDFQLPYETQPGTATVQVSDNGTLSNIVSVQVASRAPSILVYGAGLPIIVDYNTGKLYASGVSFAPGDTLVIYAIGLGQTSPAAVTGAAASGSTLETIPPPIEVMLGGSSPFDSTIQITPSFVGLAPNFVGLYQINATIPASYVPPAGNQATLSLNIQSAGSQPVSITVQ